VFVCIDIRLVLCNPIYVFFNILSGDSVQYLVTEIPFKDIKIFGVDDGYINLGKTEYLSVVDRFE